MKMSKELFGKLADAIDGVMEKYSLKIVTGHRQNINFVSVDNQFIAFCWSMLKASGFDCRELYDVGLHDSHIETALKRILSDFE